MTKREGAIWFAGLFEGEGSISPDKVRGGRRRWRLTIGSTDLDVLLKARRAIGLGRITGPYGKKGVHRKPYWHWSAHSRADVYAALAMIFGFLGERRQARAREALIDLPPVQYQRGYAR